MDNAGRNSILSGQNRRFFSRNQIRNAVVISIVLILGFQWRLLVSVTGTLMTVVRQTPTSFIRQGHFVLGTCGRSPSPKVCKWMAKQQPPSIFATQHQHLVVPFLRQTVSSLVSATTQLAGISHDDSDVLGVMDDCRDIMKLVRSNLTEATEVYGTPRCASLGEVLNFATVYLESCAGFVSEAGDKAVNTSFLSPFLFHQRRVASMLSILSWLLEEVEKDGVDKHSVLSHWHEPAATAVGLPDRIDGRTWKANLTVAKDGSGDCSTIMEALARAPLRSNERFTIVILAGIYEEYVVIGGHMTNIHFVGESRRTTIITGNRSRIYTPNVTTAGSATVGK
ncbi:hypothetical protein RJ640_002565 [Escallonia rubra]|uniref:Pectinesterase catalytic domain-containing protein n=1 Tax=Escallonia rubra TaxID=112253 RepID=A0AA88UPQ0_9ASTE|nr:hypothetical protein RJ640_002565 [Escallonia rubra]